MLAIIEMCGPGAIKAIRFLCAALKDADCDVRWAAARALGRIGPDAQEALPSLSLLMNDEDSLVRDAAAEAIKCIDK
jgi:HEAT repeat protein